MKTVRHNKCYLKRMLFSAVVAAALMLTSSADSLPKYHYEVRRDLSVYFTNADSVVEKVRESIKRRSRSVIITYTSHSDNMADIGALVREVMQFALAETDRADEGDYLACNMGGYSFEYSCEKNGGDYSYEITVTPDYYTDYEQEQQVTERINAVTAQLGLKEMDSSYEKIRAVHDYLCENVSYDYIHKKNPHYHLKSTAYAALVNGQAVCQGYAAAAYRMLKNAGVDCRVITGMAEIGGSEEYHAWNIAEADGRYYCLDITWDSQLGTDRFFLASARDFGDHRPDEKFCTESFLNAYPLSEESYY